jgi:outer membrane protein TolC
LKALCLALMGLLATASLAAAETLPEAWASAIASNRQLAAGRQQVAAAEQRVEAARARRLPSVAVAATWVLLDEAPTSVLPVPVPGVPSVILSTRDDVLAYQGTISLPVYTGGRVRAGIEAADAAHTSGQRELGTRTADLRLAVARSFLGVLKAERAVAVARASFKALTAHRDVVSDLLDEGVVARHDLLQANVAVADAERRVMAATNTLARAREAFNRLLGRPFDEPVELVEPTPPPLTDDLDGLVDRALAARSELDRLAWRATALRRRADIRRGATRPQLEITGAYTHVDNDVLTEEGFASGSIAVGWQLLDGGQAKAEARALELEADAVQHRTDDARDVITVEVRRAWRDLGTTRQQLEVARQAVAFAEEELAVAEDRYTNGVGTGSEVLDAEARLTRSRSQRDTARFDELQARIRLDRATGALEKGPAGWS